MHSQHGIRIILAVVFVIIPPMSPALADDGFDALVSVEWLAGHLGDPDVVVLDASVVTERLDDGSTRSVSGRTQYSESHIPGAGFADLTGALADGNSELRFVLPSPEQFAAAMGELGVGDDKKVVLYDSAGLVWAARVWWMLRWVGFDNAALLDGGLAAWQAAGQEVSDEAVTPVPAVLTPRVRPQLIADRDEVFAAISDNTVDLVDALPRGHYNGEWGLYARRGHIASATNVPTRSLFDQSGRFLSKPELQALFDGYRDRRAINYCGGGIAASGVAFAMTLAGIEDVAVYTNSLQEWTLDPDNPMEVSMPGE